MKFADWAMANWWLCAAKIRTTWSTPATISPANIEDGRGKHDVGQQALTTALPQDRAQVDQEDDQQSRSK